MAKAKSKAAAKRAGGGRALINSGETMRRLGGISSMTLWRWEKANVVPPPIIIRRRRYWWDDDIDAVAARFQGVSHGE